MAPESASGSPLLDLPAELRNTIYRLTLITENTITINPSTLPQRAALLQTCRVARSEATSIFYAENTFHLPLDGEQNTASIARLDTFSENLTHIRSLVLRPGLSETYWKITVAPLVADLEVWQTKPLEDKAEVDTANIKHSLNKASQAGLSTQAVSTSPLPQAALSGEEDSSRASWYRWWVVCEVAWWISDRKRAEIGNACTKSSCKG